MILKLYHIVDIMSQTHILCLIHGTKKVPGEQIDNVSVYVDGLHFWADFLTLEVRTFEEALLL